ncbi:MAG: hypothetical protein KF752_05580 [Pirellulaceae bacterium]|nr:hypothetical protein [Pirellulaceae bacterium]
MNGNIAVDRKWTVRSRLAIVSALVACHLSGCSSLQKDVSTRASRQQVRKSYVRWNQDPLAAQAATGSPLNNVRLASLPKSELKRLIENCPAPAPDTIQGQWVGINRGLGLTLIGSTLFIKEFQMCPGDGQAVPDGGCLVGQGTNLLVHQVPLECLTCQGWQPIYDPSTGLRRTQGNFAIVCRQGLELDYTLGGNRFFDPTRLLVDELVQVDEGLLLGRANFQLGRWRIPVSYFALSRRPVVNSADCSAF